MPQDSLWPHLGSLSAKPGGLTLIVGELDSKYVEESERMMQQVSVGVETTSTSSSPETGATEGPKQEVHNNASSLRTNDGDGGRQQRHRQDRPLRVVIPNSGHAVHMEQPLALMEAILMMMGGMSS